MKNEGRLFNYSKPPKLITRILKEVYCTIHILQRKFISCLEMKKDTGLLRSEEYLNHLKQP